MHKLRALEAALARVEGGLVVCLLAFMVGLAFLQVVLRNVFGTGILWADVFLRQLVLWVTFLGASLGSREGRHIRIDVLLQWLPPRGGAWAGAAGHLFAALVSLLLARASLILVADERSAGSVLFGFLPTWWFQLIIPVGFFLMGLRFLLRLPATVAEAGGRREERP
ncbi:MAG: TRAP transporter small permease [Nitrospinota bacterium]